MIKCEKCNFIIEKSEGKELELFRIKQKAEIQKFIQLCGGLTNE